MRFEFMTSARVIFGKGTVHEVGDLAASLGRKVLIIMGSGKVSVDVLLESLKCKDMAWQIFHVTGEPDVTTVVAGLEIAKRHACDMVIGFGGGSILDVSKAIAALLSNEGTLLDYLEVVGKGLQTSLPSAPLIAIPTTAGTGSEVTRNAVITSPEHKVKVSMRSAHMIPRIALVDPGLTYSMSPAVTASTGMDALTQVIEAYTSKLANPMTDALAKEGIKRGARSLRQAYRDGQDAAAREDMAVTSLFGGLALANAGLGAVHGFAGVIGGMFAAPHGAVCASLLPGVMKANMEALQADDPASEYHERYQGVAALLTDQPDASIEMGVAWVTETARMLNIPGLAGFGITRSDFSSIVSNSKGSSSMKKNPIVLSDESLNRILEEAFS